MVDRMLNGQKVIVPGDGSSLWVITHNTDFAKGFTGLLGHEQAIGHAFHITTDEVLTWDQLYRTVAEAVGVEARIVHIPSDFMIACLPEMEGTLVGDKCVSVVFDNSKIKRFVPEYVATTRFAQGIRRSLAWFDADPSRKLIDTRQNAVWDKLIGLYEAGLKNAVASFRGATSLILPGKCPPSQKPGFPSLGSRLRFPRDRPNRPFDATSPGSPYPGSALVKKLQKGLAAGAG